MEGDGGGKKMDEKKVYTYCAPLSPVSSEEEYLNIGRLFHQQVIADDGDQLAEKRQLRCDIDVLRPGIVQMKSPSTYTLAREEKMTESLQLG